MNPEMGFFSVAQGTGEDTNPSALASTREDTIFTNVAYDERHGSVYWEGLCPPPEYPLISWKGEAWQKGSGEPAAHPNGRFTAPITGCPQLGKEWLSPVGVPLSAILFGGRRAKVAPLVVEAKDFTHGAFLGSIMASETTAAATGKTGVVCRDPMAMRPFLGYNLGRYWRHWLTIGSRLAHPPRIYAVNWFRKGEDGRYLWPGYGENLRVLLWIVDRCKGQCEAKKSPIGLLPYPKDIDTWDLPAVDRDTLDKLLTPDREGYLAECQEIREFYSSVGDTVPENFYEELALLETGFLKERGE
jgi:phosphoenolpyruvate carboxykinase (GTP)